MRRSLLMICLSLLLPLPAQAKESWDVYCFDKQVATEAVRIYAVPPNLNRLTWLFWEGNILHCSYMERRYQTDFSTFVDVLYEGEVTFGYLPIIRNGRRAYVILKTDTRGT